ncbi:MAG: hypothetical protein WAK17_10530 [Candidatus Nitrosopolaris sp.]
MATNLAPFAGTLGGDGVFMDGWWANFLVKTATRLCKKSLLIHLVFSLLSLRLSYILSILRLELRCGPSELTGSNPMRTSGIIIYWKAWYELSYRIY